MNGKRNKTNKRTNKTASNIKVGKGDKGRKNKLFSDGINLRVPDRARPLPDKTTDVKYICRVCEYDSYVVVDVITHIKTAHPDFYES